MNRPFYKSLDREFEIFGMKGRWVKIFLMAAGVSLVFGIIVGSVMGSGIGVVTVIIAVAVSFFVCLTMQSRTPGRQVGRAMLAGKTSGWVLRRETLGRIILEDRRYDEVKDYVKTHKQDHENKD